MARRPNTNNSEVSQAAHPFSFILENKGVFVLGCFGGMAPIFIKIAKICLAAFDPDFAFPGLNTFFYASIAALLLGLVGGVVVCAMDEKELGKAIFLGVSAPSLILAALNPTDGQKNDSTKSAKKIREELGAIVPNIWNLNPLVTNAWAQTTTRVPIGQASPIKPLNARQDRSIEIFSLNADRTFNVVFYNQAGDELGTDQIDASTKVATSIPPDSSYIRFAAGDSLSEKFKLSGDPTTTLDFEVKVVFQEKYNLASFFTQRPKIVANFQVTKTERKRIPIGQEGWMYLGMYVGGRWVPEKRHTSLSVSPDKAVGQITTTAYGNTHIRTKPGRDDNEVDPASIPVMSLGQGIQILEVKESEKIAQAWWARIKVVF